MVLGQLDEGIRCVGCGGWEGLGGGGGLVYGSRRDGSSLTGLGYGLPIGGLGMGLKLVGPYEPVIDRVVHEVWPDTVPGTAGGGTLCCSAALPSANSAGESDCRARTARGVLVMRDREGPAAALSAAWRSCPPPVGINADRGSEKKSLLLNENKADDKVECRIDLTGIGSSEPKPLQSLSPCRTGLKSAANGA